MNHETSIEQCALDDIALQRVAAGEQLVITRAGVAFALLVPVTEETLTGQLLALRLEAFARHVRAIRDEAAGCGASKLTDEEIQAEIDAARRERRSAPRIAAAGGADPAPD